MGTMRGFRSQSVADDPLERGESGLLWVYATTTLRRGRWAFKSPPPTPPEPQHEAFWQSCCSARSVAVVEVNGYTIEPGANLTGVNLDEVKANQDTIWPRGSIR